MLLFDLKKELRERDSLIHHLSMAVGQLKQELQDKNIHIMQLERKID